MTLHRKKCLESIYMRLVDIYEEMETLISEEKAFVDSLPREIRGTSKHKAAKLIVIKMERVKESVDDAVNGIEITLDK